MGEVLDGVFAVEGCPLCKRRESVVHVHAYGRDAEGNEVLVSVRRAPDSVPGIARGESGSADGPDGGHR